MAHFQPHVAAMRSVPCARLLAKVVYRVKIERVSEQSPDKVERSSLEGRRGGRDLVLLLHELLAGGFDGDCEAELGGVLPQSVSDRTFILHVHSCSDPNVP